MAALVIFSRPRPQCSRDAPPLYPFPTLLLWGPGSSYGESGSQPGTSGTGESSAQEPTESARREKRPAESVVDSEEADLETVRLLDAAKTLELVEFDPSVNDTGEWEAPKTMSAFSKSILTGL